MHIFRTYPPAFGRRLVKIWCDADVEPLRCLRLVVDKMQHISHLRALQVIANDLSDRQLFEQLPLDDTWDDADLYTVFKYMWDSRSTHIPETWQPTMQQFELQFREAVVADPSLVAEYAAARTGQDAHA